MPRTRNLLISSVLAMVVSCTTNAVAQDSVSTARVCLNHPQPAPVCSVIVLTNFGGYYRTAREYESHLRVVADWGVLVPAGSRSAIGASIFASLDAEDFTVGPAVRYRHWSNDTKSNWEVGVGLPLNNDHTLAHGLIKWNVSPLVGIAIRPELRRTFTYAPYPGCFGPPYNCDTYGKSGAVSFGVEIGGVPGLVGAGASIVGLLGLLASTRGD